MYVHSRYSGMRTDKETARRNRKQILYCRQGEYMRFSSNTWRHVEARSSMPSLANDIDGNFFKAWVKSMHGYTLTFESRFFQGQTLC